jgi:hypothetical protein
MANNSEEGQGPQRAVVPVLMMMINWKGFGRKRSRPNADAMSECLEGLRKTTKMFVMIAGVLAEIRMEHLPNTSLR